MIDADRPAGQDGLSDPERDAMVATLLGITPERLRTIRRVHSKRAGSAKPSGCGGPEAPWQRIDQLSDDALFATFRRREVRARAVALAGMTSPVDRTPRRTVGRR